MYQLTRIISHDVVYTESSERHTIVKALEKFDLTDSEFKFLQSLKKEYNYYIFDNEIYIDRHPSVLEEGIKNVNFIEDYTKNLTDKFYVLYEYKEI